MNNSIFCILEDLPGYYTVMKPDKEKGYFVPDGENNTREPNAWNVFGFEEEVFLGYASQENAFEKMLEELQEILKRKQKGAGLYDFAILLKYTGPMNKKDYFYFKYLVLVHRY